MLDQDKIPANPEEINSPSTRESLDKLKTDISKTASPEAKKFVETYSEKYSDLKNSKLAEKIGVELPIPPEQLAKEYQQVDTLKKSTEIIAGTRSQIQKVIDFVMRVIPNYIKQMLNKGPEHDLDEVEKLGVKMDTFSPLVDLSAFDLKKLRSGQLNLEKLKEKGLKEIVLMEDRDPLFFLNYKDFSPNSPVPLDRHGRPPQDWTMADLRKFTEMAHQAGLKVTIGFWGNAKNAEKNPFIKKNWEALKPVIPGSDDLNPLSIVKDQDGKPMPFADYILKQYGQLVKDFHFDGLFLGDGLMGYRSFQDSEAPYDFSSTSKLWTDFYRRLYLGVHQITPEGKLWAYDVMGKGNTKAIKHGIDLKAISPYLDTYIFQAYGSDAWGQDYMKLPGYDLTRDKQEISDLPPELAAKTKYTLAFGDKVEGWSVKSKTIQEKHQAINSYAKLGSFGVWSNQAIRKML